MAFTYLGDLSTDRDVVRFALGDVVTADPLFTDAEIDGALTLYSTPLLAAAALADSQAAKYSRYAAISIDGADIQYNQRADMFRALATRLRTQATADAAGGIGAPFVGGVSKADMDAQRDDDDREPNRFEVGGMDYPGTVLSSSRTTVSETDD